MKSTYPLSHPQMRIWYTEKLWPNTSVGNVAGILKLKENIDLAIMFKAINIFLYKNDSMRIVVRETDGIPKQFISNYKETTIKTYEFQNTSELEKWGDNQTLIPFELLENNLFYFAIVKTPDENGIYAKLHHLICDAWTMTLIGDQILEYYYKIKNGKELSLSQDKNPSYLDYVKDEIKFLESERFMKMRNHWIQKFENVPQKTSLSVSSNKVNNTKSRRMSFTLNNEVTQNIYLYCKKNSISTYTLFLSILGIYISRITNNKDITILTTLLNRATAKEKNTLGMFVNTLPLRFSIESDMDIKMFIRKLSSEQFIAMKNHKYPYDFIAKDLREVHKASEIEVSDVMLSYQNAKFLKKDIEIDTKWYFNQHQTTPLIIHINDRENHGELLIDLDYLVDFFSEDEIRKFQNRIQNILISILNDSINKISEVEILTKDERNQILLNFNNTKSTFSTEKLLHEYLEENADKYPDRVAILYGDKEWTYKEINEKANKIARNLRGKGVESGHIVALFADRSIEMIIGIFGILKAGAAYLPIEPLYPRERIKYLIEDSCAHILLTQKKYSNLIDLCENIMFVDEDDNYLVDGSNLQLKYDVTSLSYVIYTSGSTGKPKGVMIEHRSVLNRILWMIKEYSLNDTEVFLQKTPFVFDVSVWEIFTWSFIGAKLCILPNESEKNPEEIINEIYKYNVSLIHFVPSALNVFIDYIESNSVLEKLKGLKRVFTSGEALKPKQVERFNKTFYINNGTLLTNLYGPTEATVEVSYFNCPPGENIAIVPIGKPIDNTNLFVVDSYNKLQPIGVVGELCISGVCLARGYINNHSLTTKKFVENLFVIGERMYKTGDMARISYDGNIEYLGRLDNQIKIRGIRIELGEIESCLLQYEGINEVIIIPREDSTGENILCAFIVNEGILEINEIKNFLGTLLPTYMIPTFYVKLDAIPLTINGKVDRKALLNYEIEMLRERSFIKPQNYIEVLLTKIWIDILEVTEISVDDNFFELGGHSLNVMKLSAAIQQEFNYRINIKSFFENPTIIYLSSVLQQRKDLLNKDYLGNYEEKELIPINNQDFYPLTTTQRKIFYHNKVYDDLSFNMPGVITIDGNIDRVILENSFNRIISKHEIFRTSFTVKDDDAVHLILPKVNFYIDYSEGNVLSIEEMANDFLKQFSLNKPPLIRVKLIQIHSEKYIMLFDIHHIIADGVSLDILFNELIDLYEGKENIKLKFQYKDFTIWKKNVSNSFTYQQQKEYWINNFRDNPPIIKLPTDYNKLSKKTYIGDSVYLDIDNDLLNKLKETAVKKDATLFMVLLTGLYTLLAKYTGQHDITLGMPVTGRTKPEFEGIIGMFVNTLPIRNRPIPTKEFCTLLSEVKENVGLAIENQDVLYEDLIEELHSSYKGKADLFNVIVNYRIINNPVKIGNSKISSFKLNNKIAKNDLTVYFNVNIDSLTLEFNYKTALFKKESIQYLQEEYISLLNQIVVKPDIKIAEYNIFEQKEKKNKNIIKIQEKDFRELIKSEFSNSIVQRFEEIVELFEHKNAVISKSNTITYLELNKKANQVANMIVKLKKESGAFIGLLFDHEVALTVGILSVLKSGNAYVPLDPSQPLERNDYIIKDAGIKLIVTNGRNLSIAKNITRFDDVVILNIDELDGSESFQNLNRFISPNDIAYLLYTSGSTGNPKGVIQNHKNVLHFIRNYTNNLNINSNDRLSLLSTYTFDAAVMDIYSALLNGATLCMLNIKDEFDDFFNWLNRERLTIFHTVPTLYRYFIDSLQKNDLIENVRLVVLGGEAVYQKDVESYKMHFNDSCIFVNGLGPTESTVTLQYIINKSFKSNSYNVPVGYPVEDTKVYIINDLGRESSVFEVGEIVYKSEHLALGYWNQPEMTNSFFGIDSITGVGRVFKSGDLGRYLQDGSIEFLGRKDNQVKIRGYRVEISEVENYILTFPQVKSVAVVAKYGVNGDRSLIAYILCNETVSISELRNFLSNILPDYMIPSFFVKVNEFPLTNSGKINKKVLENIEINTMMENEHVGPRDSNEVKLANMFMELLKLNEVSIYDNFFENGGHSLKAMKLKSMISNYFNVEIPLEEIFKSPTISELADKIKYLTKNNKVNITKVQDTEYYEASSAQKRMFILNYLDIEKIAYNINGAIKIDGNINYKKFEEAIMQLISRHESLRTSLEIINNNLVQRIHSEVDFTIDHFEVSEENIQNTINGFIRPFAFENAPLFRVGLLKITDQSHVLVFDMHHCVSDGTSINILLNDFMKIYNGFELENLKFQYKDFSEWQKKYFMTENFINQEKYWLNKFKDEIPFLNLPSNSTVNSGEFGNGERFTFSLSKDLTEELYKLSITTETTIYMILLSAYNILLWKITGQRDIVVGTPVAGRPSEMENVVGMFVNTLAMRNYPDGNKQYIRFLNEVRNNSLESFENQDYPFDLIVEKLNLSGNNSIGNPLFDTMFVLQNMDKEEFRLNNLTCNPFDIPIRGTKLSLALYAFEKEVITFNLDYLVSKFNKDFIECIAKQYIEILDVVTKSPSIILFDL